MRHLLAAMALLPIVALAEETPLKYPQTRKVDHVDDYHGTKVSDPYRWLEEDVRTNTEVAAWVAAQNQVTEAYLESIPERPAIKQRMTDLFNYEKISAPSKRGGLYFTSRNDGLQNQAALSVQDKLDREPRLLLDPNAWSPDGTIALAGFSVSDDGNLAAFAKAGSGSDWSTWHVLEVDTGKVLPDELKWMKFSSVSWTQEPGTKAGKGFYYSRFPEPKTGGAFQALNTNMKLYYHVVGTPQSEDKLIYELPENPTWGINGGVTDDGDWLVISISDGTTSRKNKLIVRKLRAADAKFIELVANHENKFSLVDNDGGKFYLHTDWHAPMNQVIVIDSANPDPKNWKTIIPEAKDALQAASIVGSHFICDYLQDAKSVVKVFDLSGKYVRDVALPGIGTAGGFSGKRGDSETFYSFSSFATPPSIFRYDAATGESKLLRQAKVNFKPDDFEVKQVFYPSKDGTKIPMFITCRKGMKLDGTKPCLLYGYGGFDISQPPTFSPSRIAWMEMGGILAVANLRGGGEFGEAWHRAGTKLHKQNVFDDFIAAAEYLIKEKYASSKKLAIQGRSNGGLLVGACMTQRPELFAAALPAVGVMDMLRFQKFTAGRYWVDDYGSSDNAEEFKALYAYSPYHNIKPGVKYPATLVTTADTDDRVVPGHSFKFTARLQECQAGPAPVLARIESKAGHGVGRPTTKQIEEAADQWAFLVKSLDIKLK